MSLNSLGSIEIEKIRNVDIATFEKLFRHFFQPLVQFSNRYVQDVQLSEDIVQDVFLNVWKNRKSIQSDCNIKAYLFTATKNQALKKLRHLKIEREYAINALQINISENSLEDMVNEKELRQSIEKAIQALPEKCRIIFCMSRFDKLTYSEIAAIQNVSIKTVETHMVRALKILRKKIFPLFF